MCNLPFFEKALDAAVRQGMFVGLHPESRSVVFHFDEAQQSQRVCRKLATILGKGAVAKVCIKGVESFDTFHAEKWGIVEVSSPKMPDAFDSVVEEDDLDLEDVDEERVDAGLDEVAMAVVNDEDGIEDLVVQRPDIFTLAVLRPAKMNHVPSTLNSLDMDTKHAKDLRDALTKAGGVITPYLEHVIFPRGIEHTREVQEEAMAMGRTGDIVKTDGIHCIHWITPAPKFITIYGKPKMEMKRRSEWIEWKAGHLGLDLNLPTFMFIFKQTTFHEDTPMGCKLRMQQFKRTVEQWQGTPLDWESVSSEDKNLVANINAGKNVCYCRSCKRVLDPKAVVFCSKYCASQFCICGDEFAVRRVIDQVADERRLNALGPYSGLVDLAHMASLKSRLEGYSCIHDFNVEFDKITQRRQAEKCCNGITGYVEKGSWCSKCLMENGHVNYMQRTFGMINSGQFTWGHCMEAAARVKRICETPRPMMDQLYCESCDSQSGPSSKRQRVE